MLTALQDRFRVGGPAAAAREVRPAGFPRWKGSMAVLGVQMSPLGSAPIVVVDGSAGQDGFAAAAAVAADGSALVGWCELPGATSQFAEFQAVRLVLHLAATARWDSARIFCDTKSLCDALADPRTGRGRIIRTIGFNDAAGITDVLEGLRERPVSLQWMQTAGNKHQVGPSQAALRAHRLAWVTRRMVSNGVDPEGALAELARYAHRTGKTRAAIVESGTRLVKRQMTK